MADGAASSPLLTYQAIFNFGDSLSDTGNLILTGTNTFLAAAKLPYGETFFKQPTGRLSNGRLIVDFIGKWLHSLIQLFYLKDNESLHPYIW